MESRVVLCSQAGVPVFLESSACEVRDMQLSYCVQGKLLVALLETSITAVNMPLSVFFGRQANKGKSGMLECCRGELPEIRFVFVQRAV